jgi:Zn-dependent protease
MSPDVAPARTARTAQSPLGQASLTLLRVGGVPLRIHLSWLFAAVYLVALFASDFRHMAARAGVPASTLLLPPLGWAVLMMLALFTSVVLHELAHVTVARRGGARVRSITLMMLGGVSEISEIDKPWLELLMALAGPLLSLLLAAALLGLAALAGGAPPDVRFGLFYIAQANAIIGLFNLLPAFPMDGGRVLRSLLEPRLGKLRATDVAATVGKVLAVALAAAGIVIGGWWLVLIAAFIFIGGEAETRALHERDRLAGLEVADFYVRRIAAVPADAPVAQAVAQMLAQRTDGCLVTRDAAVVGAVGASAVARIPVRARADVPVDAVMSATAVVALHDQLTPVLRRMDDERLELLAVRDGDVVIGMLDRSDIARGLKLRELIPTPA